MSKGYGGSKGKMKDTNILQQEAGYLGPRTPILNVILLGDTKTLGLLYYQYWAVTFVGARTTAVTIE